MKYIGLLSDTHSIFDQPLKKFFEPVDEIWHAGDFGNLATAQDIAQFKPLKGVYGNCDDTKIRMYHPYIQDFVCEGFRILMIHIGGYPGRYRPEIRRLIEERRPGIFICGHSHILKIIHDQKYDMLTINPGAAGLQGFHLVRTAVRFKLDKGRIFDMEVGEWEKRY